MLDFRTETFLTVCQTLNYTRAARLLHITQPAVSQHIQFIEEFYGVKVFAQNGKKTSLTKEGQRLLDALTTAKHDDLHLKEMLLSEGARKQKLHFGATLSICEYVIPDIVARLMEHNPDMDITVATANTELLLAKLNRGEIDFALVEGYFAKNEYDSLVYSSEEYIALVRCGHPLLAGTSCVRFEDLFPYTLVTRENGSGSREILQRSLEERNFSIQDFKNRVEVGNLNAMKSIVQKTDSIMFAYKIVAKEEMQYLRLKPLLIKDFSAVHDFTYIWRKNSIFSDYYRELFAAVI